MPVPPPHFRRALAAAPLLLALATLGCASDVSTSSSAASAPDASSFPSAKGKTLADLEAEGSASELVVAPTSQIFERGENRYGFGLFTVNNESIGDGEVAIYVAAARPDGPAIGPFPAAVASLETEPAFASLTTTDDPDVATVVYTADVEFPSKGEWRALALIREDDGRLSYSRAVAPALVDAGDAVPDVGEPAPEMHTPTAGDVGGDLSRIDTRQPPDTMHDVDYADVLGKEPIVLSFATPALCTSRACGPVVDIAEEVKAQRPDDAAYVHMEIYTDNDPNKGPNEQVKTFGLPSEPWLFVIDSDGKVSTRIEGAYSEDELNAALDEVS